MDITPGMVGAFFAFSVGLLILLRPQAFGKFTDNEPTGSAGRAQLRALGGFFLVLGVAAIIVNTTMIYRVLGAGWAGAAIGRLTSSILDKEVTGLTAVIAGGELFAAVLFFIEA